MRADELKEAVSIATFIPLRPLSEKEKKSQWIKMISAFKEKTRNTLPQFQLDYSQFIPKLELECTYCSVKVHCVPTRERSMVA
jgi:hypothetical protein